MVSANYEMRGIHVDIVIRVSEPGSRRRDRRDAEESDRTSRTIEREGGGYSEEIGGLDSKCTTHCFSKFTLSLLLRIETSHWGSEKGKRKVRECYCVMALTDTNPNIPLITDE
jgi:hypothetical protein